MTTFQGIIKFKQNRILSFEPDNKGITLINGDQIQFFENCCAFTGFTDHHGHILSLGKILNGLNLENAKSAEECVDLCMKFNSFRGEWLTGRGWNQEKWLNNEFPNKIILDKYFPYIPVYLVRIDGHAAWVNSYALKLAGISSNSINPPGGTIIKDKNGYPNGILIDNAMNLVSCLIPKHSRSQNKKFILDSIKNLKNSGICEVHDMDVSLNTLDILTELAKDDKLEIAVKVYLKAQNDEWLSKNVKPYEIGKLTVEGVKLYSDGALGSSGAALLEPYSDNPSEKGLLLINRDELISKSIKALENGFKVAVHAIGDSANRMVINSYNYLLEMNIASNNDLRIEHAQIIHPDDIIRLKKMAERDNKIILSVQPIHCLSDATMAIKRLGKRCNYAYPWKTLIETGHELIAGSDFPIEPFDVFAGINAFVKRTPPELNLVWYGNEKLTFEEAISSYCCKRIEKGKVKINKIAKNEPANFSIIDFMHNEINSENFMEIKFI